MTIEAMPLLGRRHNQPAPTPATTPSAMIAAALHQLQAAPEPDADLIAAIKTISSKLAAGYVTAPDFQQAHAALYAAGLESGGLHIILSQAEEALRIKRQLMPAAR